MLLPLFVQAATVYGFDETMFRAINLAGTNVVLDAIMLLFTTLTLPYVVGLLVLPLWWRGHKEAAVDFLVLLLAVIAVTETIKYAVGAPRPCTVLSGVHLLTPTSCAAEPDPAFPSGHTSRAFALALFVAHRFRWRLGTFALVVAAIVGVSRIYLGVHWPSDVLGGAVVGLAIAVLLRGVERRSLRYQDARTRVVTAIGRAFHGPRSA